MSRNNRQPAAEPFRRNPNTRTGSGCCLCVLLLVILIPTGLLAAPQRIIIEGLGDAAKVGRDHDPDGGSRYWSWNWGGLVVTDPALAVEEAGSAIHLDCGPGLRGMSKGRRLKIEDGQYRINAPLLLSDRGFQLLIASGSLVIDGETLRVGREAAPKTRADLMLFLGLLLLTIVLLRNLRRKRSGK